MSFTQEQYNAHFLKSRTVYVKVEILNNQDVMIDRLDGISIDGSMNINADSLIRRTANIKFILYDYLLPTQESKLAINNRVRLWIGLSDYNDNIYYFNLGIFIINDISIDVSISEKTISLNLVDKMYLLENIPLEFLTKLNVDTPIDVAMKTTIQTLGSENKLLIETHPNSIPYDLEFRQDDNISKIVETLRDLYKSWETFYNTNGYFVFRKIPDRLSDPIIWSFTDEADFRINGNIGISYSNVKNYIKVFGKTLDNGITVSAIAQDDDINSLFAISKIGKKSIVVNNENYFTDEQCQQLADYELYRHTNFQDKINISCLPIYLLNVNKIVEFNSSEENLVGKYLIDSISIPLKFDGNMSFQGHKIF